MNSREIKIDLAEIIEEEKRAAEYCIARFPGYMPLIVFKPGKGTKLHLSNNTSSVCNCGLWLRADACMSAVASSVVPASKLCKKCFKHYLVKAAINDALITPEEEAAAPKITIQVSRNENRNHPMFGKAQFQVMLTTPYERELGNVKGCPLGRSYKSEAEAIADLVYRVKMESKIEIQRSFEEDEIQRSFEEDEIRRMHDCRTEEEKGLAALPEKSKGAPWILRFDKAYVETDHTKDGKGYHVLIDGTGAHWFDYREMVRLAAEVDTWNEGASEEENTKNHLWFDAKSGTWRYTDFHMDGAITEYNPVNLAKVRGGRLFFAPSFCMFHVIARKKA